MLTGLNHLTLAISDLPRSIAFYQTTLGLRLHARWNRGAYLTAGELWLCLSLDTAARQPASGYTHYAFNIDEQRFERYVKALRAAGVTEWQQNTSEGESFYFLDPDGHKLEVHSGDISARLAACRAAPYEGMEFFPD